MTRPCCLSCTRLDHRMGEPDEDEPKPGRNPTCGYLGRWPEYDLMYGQTQCDGYTPRPSWDFASPDDSMTLESGAVVALPMVRDLTPRRTRETREVVIIIPPDNTEPVFVVPPPDYGKPKYGLGDNQDIGGHIHRVAAPKGGDMGIYPAIEASDGRIGQCPTN